jgi:hypothetical protein
LFTQFRHIVVNAPKQLDPLEPIDGSKLDFGIKKRHQMSSVAPSSSTDPPLDPRAEESAVSSNTSSGATHTKTGKLLVDIEDDEDDEDETNQRQRNFSASWPSGRPKLLDPPTSTPADEKSSRSKSISGSNQPGMNRLIGIDTDVDDEPMELPQRNLLANQPLLRRKQRELEESRGSGEGLRSNNSPQGAELPLPYARRRRATRSSAKAPDDAQNPEVAEKARNGAEKRRISKPDSSDEPRLSFNTSGATEPNMKNSMVGIDDDEEGGPNEPDRKSLPSRRPNPPAAPAEELRMRSNSSSGIQQRPMNYLMGDMGDVEDDDEADEASVAGSKKRSTRSSGRALEHSFNPEAIVNAGKGTGKRRARKPEHLEGKAFAETPLSRLNQLIAASSSPNIEAISNICAAHFREGKKAFATRSGKIACPKRLKELFMRIRESDENGAHATLQEFGKVFPAQCVNFIMKYIRKHLRP